MLNGKTILVANATSSIASTLIQKGISNGASIIGCTRRNLNEENCENVYINTCLKDEGSIRDFIENNCPLLDGIVISIGNVSLRPLVCVSPKFLRDEIDAHLTIPITLISYLLRNKRLKKGVSIVLISSINGIFVTSTGSCVYGLLKSAICGFSKGLAKEIENINGRCNCICPGVIDSMQLRKRFPEDLIKDMQKQNITGRLISLEDIAEAAIFLLSDKAKNITGTNIVIDGGYSII